MAYENDPCKSLVHLYGSHVPPSTEERQRARLARALDEFWAGGAGPTHGEIDDVLELFDLNCDIGSKRDRVSEAIRSAEAADVATLVSELIDLLRTGSVFSPDFEYAASQSEINALREALVPFGLELSDDGRLRPAAGLVANPETLPDVPALREHVGRMQRALADGDTALLIGSSKELLETTAKLVLARFGESVGKLYRWLQLRAV